MIRVLQVLEATEGGTLTHLRALLAGLDPGEFEQSVALGLARGDDLADELAHWESQGVGVHVGPLQRALRPGADLRALLWLRGVVARGRYDVVHTHAAKAGMLGRLAARAAGVPVIYSPHGWPFLNPEFSPRRQRLFAAIERWAARYTTHLLAVSAGEAAAAEQWRIGLAERLTVARNGVDLAALSALPAPTRGDLGLAADAFVVLTIGRRVPQKGERFLLDAWPDVLAHRPDAVLLLIGDGPLEADLHAQAEALGIAASVRFLGRLAHAARYLPLADVYVLPSLFEGCPYSLIEAMAFGRACLATAVDGSRELIAEGETGRLVRPGDSAGLGGVLVELALDADQRARLGAAAAAFAREQLDVQRQMAVIADVYRRIALG